jgi:hypothetical protein
MFNLLQTTFSTRKLRENYNNKWQFFTYGKKSRVAKVDVSFLMKGIFYALQISVSLMDFLGSI